MKGKINVILAKLFYPTKEVIKEVIWISVGLLIAKGYGLEISYRFSMFIILITAVGSYAMANIKLNKEIKQ